jgi:hypothetical protein
MTMQAQERSLSLVGRKRKQSLADWIREAMTDDEKSGKITALALVHKNGSSEREIDAVRFGGRTWKEEDLAARFQGKAESYSQELLGVQEFCLFAFYGERNAPEAAHPFVIQGETGVEAGFGTFTPDVKGEKMQGMAFNQALVQLCYRQTSILFEAQQRLIETLGSKLGAALDDNHDLFDLCKEMILKAADKEHEHRMSELQFMQSADTRKQLLRMAPALANQFTGKELFPQSMADTSIVEGLLEKLIEMPEGTLPLVLTQLGIPAEGQAAIMLRAKQYAEKKAQELEDAKTLTARKPEFDEGEG